MSFHAALIEAAKAAGFPLAGALDLERALNEKLYKDDLDFYDRWIAAGHHGTMEYLARGRDRRADPKIVFPEAKSILCVAWPYSAKPAGAEDPSIGPRYARYLRSRDYHKDIAERLETMMRGLASRIERGSELKWKVCVDTSAVFERRWAALAGVGWIGKNTLLIHPKLGSYLFLAEVLVNRETGEGPKPLPNLCGHCTRCLRSCPTRALPEPGTVDSTRCISYHTLENRGPIELEEEAKNAFGPWIAGCDWCQEACPFNTKAARTAAEADDQAIAVTRWEELLDESEDSYKTRVKNSSLSRVKPAMFRRNLAIVLANCADTQDFRRLAPRIENRMKDETDPVAKVEWAHALDRILKFTH